jgi:hypothetical protein
LTEYVKQDLYIRNVFGGKALLEANKSGLSFDIRHVPESDGWHIKLHVEDVRIAEQVLNCKEELNVFVVEQREGEPQRKWWYPPAAETVRYDENTRELSFFAGKRLSYNG